MTNIILLKRSNTPGHLPTTSQIQIGELAFNSADGVLYCNYTPGGSGPQTIKKLTPSISSDITSILGYTPVNQAGDTISGTLVLNNMALPAGMVSSSVAAGISVTTIITTLDTYSASLYQSVKYTFSINGGVNGYEMSDLAVIQDGTNVWISEYGRACTSGTALVTFSASLTAGTMTITGQSATGTVIAKFIRIAISS